MGQSAAWAVENGEVLHRVGMPVLEPAIGKPAQVEVPAAADCLHRIGRRPAAFFQAIQGKRAALAGDGVGQLLDLEVLGPLFDLHCSYSRRQASRLPGTTADSAHRTSQDACPT